MKFHTPCNSFTPRQVVTPAEEKRLRGGERQEVASSREHCGSLVMFWRGKATQIHENQLIDWQQRTRERKDEQVNNTKPLAVESQTAIQPLQVKGEKNLKPKNLATDALKSGRVFVSASRCQISVFHVTRQRSLKNQSKFSNCVLYPFCHMRNNHQELQLGGRNTLFRCIF